MCRSVFRVRVLLLQALLRGMSTADYWKRHTHMCTLVGQTNTMPQKIVFRCDKNSYSLSLHCSIILSVSLIACCPPVGYCLFACTYAHARSRVALSILRLLTLWVVKLAAEKAWLNNCLIELKSTNIVGSECETICSENTGVTKENTFWGIKGRSVNWMTKVKAHNLVYKIIYFNLLESPGRELGIFWRTIVAKIVLRQARWKYFDHFF